MDSEIIFLMPLFVVKSDPVGVKLLQSIELKAIIFISINDLGQKDTITDMLEL